MKKGDWVVITRSDRNWGSGMDKFDGKVVQIDVYGTEGSIFKPKLENWNWVQSHGHFRLATPEEIPGYVKPDEYPIF